jgi:hypothetical protein
MDGICSTRGRNEKCKQTILIVTYEERKQLRRFGLICHDIKVDVREVECGLDLYGS